MDPTKVEFLNTAARWLSFLRLFGLCDLQETGRSVGKISYVTSPKKTIFCTAVLLLFSCLFITQIAYSNGIFYRYLGRSLLNVYIVYNGFPVTILLLLANLLDSKNWGVLLTNIIKCEFSFCKRDNRIVARRSIRFFSTFAFIFLSSLIFDLIRLYYEGGTMIMILNPIASFTCAIYCMVCVLQFAMILFWMERAFKRINMGLIHNCKIDKNCFNLTRIPIISDDVLRDMVSVETIQQSFDKDKILSKKPNNNKSITDEIKNLRLLYNKVYKLSREADGIFSNKNVLIVSANLIMSIIYLFLVLRFTVLYSRNSGQQNGIDLISSIKGALVSLLNISSLVLSCRSTCTEAKKSAEIIQDYIITVNDQDLKAELRDFATQIQHEHVHISPHGLFSFENSMLLSILSAVATYLVILIQFNP